MLPVLKLAALIYQTSLTLKQHICQELILAGNVFWCYYLQPVKSRDLSMVFAKNMGFPVPFCIFFAICVFLALKVLLLP